MSHRAASKSLSATGSSASLRANKATAPRAQRRETAPVHAQRARRRPRPPADRRETARVGGCAGGLGRPRAPLPDPPRGRKGGRPFPSPRPPPPPTAPPVRPRSPPSCAPEQSPPFCAPFQERFLQSVSRDDLSRGLALPRGGAPPLEPLPAGPSGPLPGYARPLPRGSWSHFANRCGFWLQEPRRQAGGGCEQSRTRRDEAGPERT